MAVHKATRSNPSAQPQLQDAKTARAGNAKPQRFDLHHQLKADLFEALRHLNRGYGVALSAFDRLETRDHLYKPRAFSAMFLQDYRNRTEALRAQANRDLLRLLAGREEHEAERFGRLCGQNANRKRRH
jgi:hypothetical protein